MKDLTKGNEGRQILTFAVPMLIGNVFQQLYNIVDSIVVGKYVGSVALAAVGAVKVPASLASMSFRKASLLCAAMRASLKSGSMIIVASWDRMAR